MSNYHIASLLRFCFIAFNKFMDQELYIVWQPHERLYFTYIDKCYTVKITIYLKTLQKMTYFLFLVTFVCPLLR